MAHLFQLQAKGLQSDDCRHELLLVPLDTLNGDDAVGHLVGLLRLGGLGLCSLFLCIFGGPLLRFDG